MSTFADMATMRNFETVCDRCEVYRPYAYVMMMMMMMMMMVVVVVVEIIIIIIIIIVPANRPDIIIKNKQEKTCTQTDVAIPADRNVVQKEAEKKLNTRIYV